MRYAFLPLALVACGAPADPDALPTPATWYADADNDGFGNPNAPSEAFEAPAGTVDDPTDCDDTRADVHPGAPETCDGADQDCDTFVDEEGAVDAVSWWLDADRDGYGDPEAAPILACRYNGRIDNDDDCDDTRADVHPGAVEVCDALDADDDCDGLADDADDVIDARTRRLWYADLDADGYGDPAAPRWACDLPPAHQTSQTDCDDRNAGIHPGATERCNGVDDDCEPITPALDPGTVVRVAPDFTFHDVTVDWTGTATSPAVVSTEPGTYWVCDGIWYVTVHALLDVAIYGPGGADAVVLDAAGAGTVVTVDVADVTLEGLTIRNGEGDNDLSGATGRDGGGVACLGGSITATDVVFADNHAAKGGGVAAIAFCDVTLVNSVFQGNAADSNGGAVFGDQITLTATGTVFATGTAVQGGGVFIDEALSAVNFDDCLFQGNQATQGAGLYAQQGLFVCTGSSTTVAGFHANTASSGAAVELASVSSASFDAETCDFGDEGTADDNRADVRVGGVTYAYGEDATFSCTRTGCK